MRRSGQGWGWNSWKRSTKQRRGSPSRRTRSLSRPAYPCNSACAAAPSIASPIGWFSSSCPARFECSPSRTAAGAPASGGRVCNAAENVLRSPADTWTTTSDVAGLASSPCGLKSPCRWFDSAPGHQQLQEITRMLPSAAPAGQSPIDLAPHRLARLAALHPAHQQLVVARVPVTDGGDDRQGQGALFHLPRRRRSPDPAALAHRRMPRDGLRLFGRAPWKEPPDPVRHRSRERLVVHGPTFGLARLAPRPHLGVRQACRLGLPQRGLLDQKTLPLVSLARSAEADHHRPELACRLGPARERGVAAAEEDEMVQLGAGEAKRSWPLHDQQVPGALALAAGPIVQRRDDDQFLHVGGDDKRAQMGEDPIPLALAISPSGAVHLDARPSPESCVPAALSRTLTADLARGPGFAFLQLAARHPGETLPPSVAFFRDLGALFLARACALPEGGVDAPVDELARLATGAPPISGGEYLRTAAL